MMTCVLYDSSLICDAAFRSGSTFDKFHAEHPKEPMMATECCSCLSQRGEDFDECPVPRTCVGSSCHVDCAHDGKAEESNGTFYNNEISQCTAQQVNESDSRKFVAGTFVWSGFDVSNVAGMCRSKIDPPISMCRR
jgi:hypothetical protein